MDFPEIFIRDITSPFQVAIFYHMSNISVFRVMDCPALSREGKGDAAHRLFVT